MHASYKKQEVEALSPDYCLITMSYKTKTSLTLPFKGVWMVANGGRDPEKNNHFNTDGSGPKNQRFAYDFVSRHVKNEGNNLEDYEAFGAEVIAPADGVICQVVDGSVDVFIGEHDDFVLPGNMIVIDHKNGEWSILAHFKHDSITVKVGDRVKRGGKLGLCGNTGNTSEPHVHYHLQDNAFLHKAAGLPAQFLKVKINGGIKEDIELERGQRVENVV